MKPRTKSCLIAVPAVIAIGFLTPSATAQPEETSQYVGDDAVVIYDNAGDHMAIVFDDGGGFEYTSGTVQNINDLESGNRTVCIFEDNIDQDFVDIFEPGEGFFEGELFGDRLTDNERETVVNTATCYSSESGTSYSTP